MKVRRQRDGCRRCLTVAQRLSFENHAVGDLQLDLARAEDEEAIIAARRGQQAPPP